MNLDELRHLKAWVGRSEQRVDLVVSSPLAALAATLDRREPEPPPGSDIAPLSHWLFFHPLTPGCELAADGHPARGGLLPPVPLPRRMCAGGRLLFNHPLQVGDEVLRTSRVTAVEAKAGRCGPLVFVTVQQEITNARGLAILEQQDIVYGETGEPAAESPPGRRAQGDAQFRKEIVPDPILLFRYSALTFNSHRIHYDRDYAVGAQGYPGLVVHGSLIATLLVDTARAWRSASTLKRYNFAAVRPLFDIHRFAVCGREASPNSMDLWAQDHQGYVAMRAEAVFN